MCSSDLKKKKIPFSVLLGGKQVVLEDEAEKQNGSLCCKCATNWVAGSGLFIGSCPDVVSSRCIPLLDGFREMIDLGIWYSSGWYISWSRLTSL